MEVTRSDDPRHRAYHEANRRAGRYVGETRMQFQFAGECGPFFPWLHVDPGTLEAHAAEAGLEVEVLVQEETGEYLAALER